MRDDSYGRQMEVGTGNSIGDFEVMDDRRSTQLQDLPLEMLDMVLMKTMLIKVSEWLTVEPPSNFFMPLIIIPLRSVWSEWNYRIAARWFRIVFKRLLKKRTVSFHLLEKLFPSPNYLTYGVAVLENSICILCCQPKIVCVYDNSDPFALSKEIHIDDIESPHSMASCKRSGSLYITDRGTKCIWKVSRNNFQPTLWLNGISKPFTLSFSADENHLLSLRDGKDSSALEIYGLDAVLVRSLSLPDSFHFPLHAVQLSNENFVVSHWKSEADTVGKWVISQLNSNGHLISQFSSSEKLQALQYPRHLALNRNRQWLIVSDYGNDRVLLFSSKSLAWKQILLTREDDRIRLPRLCYDEANEMLVVGNFGADMNFPGGIIYVYELTID